VTAENPPSVKALVGLAVLAGLVVVCWPAIRCPWCRQWIWGWRLEAHAHRHLAADRLESLAEAFEPDGRMFSTIADLAGGRTPSR
jgi:hypothetical protein